MIWVTMANFQPKSNFRYNLTLFAQWYVVFVGLWSFNISLLFLLWFMKVCKNLLLLSQISVKRIRQTFFVKKFVKKFAKKNRQNDFVKKKFVKKFVKKNHQKIRQKNVSKNSSIKSVEIFIKKFISQFCPTVSVFRSSARPASGRRA